MKIFSYCKIDNISNRTVNNMKQIYHNAKVYTGDGFAIGFEVEDGHFVRVFNNESEVPDQDPSLDFYTMNL